MSYQVLARKWRPVNFAQMVGQEHVVQALSNALTGDRLHHAYLFSGTRGVGKTTVARIFAKSLNCETGISASPCGECTLCAEIDEGRSVDLIEIDAASRTGVDDMRELLDNVQYAPTRSRFKIYLIDEVHMLSRHSFNALLKTLEEPPSHIKFLLATTDPQKIPVTVLSRCLQFNLKRMSRVQILEHLQFLTRQEEIDAESSALALLAAAADGSMRDALSLLDQAIGYGAGEVSSNTVESMLGSLSHDFIVRLLTGLGQQDPAELLAAARSVIEHNPDYQRICADMIEWLQAIAFYQVDPTLAEAAELDMELLKRFSLVWSADEIQLYYQILLQGRQDLLIAPDAASGFEMLMLRLYAFAPHVDGVPAADSVSSSSVAPSNDIKKKSDESVVTVISVAADSPSLEKSSIENWNQLVYELDLDGLAQQIVVNSMVASYVDQCLQLTLPSELYELLNSDNREDIRKALAHKLGTSLRLEWAADQTTTGVTPAQAKLDQEEQDRKLAIDQIKKSEIASKLKRTLAAELDEASVVRVENNMKNEVV